MREFDVVVVGTGPTALAAFSALPAGIDVAVVDIGFRAGRNRNTTSLDSTDPIEPYLGRKLKFDSGFTYSYPRGFFTDEVNSHEIPTSGARGGFSTSWGAGLQVLGDDELIDWPVSSGEMQWAYRKVLEFMPVVGGDQGTLKSRFVWPEQFKASLPLTRRMSRLLQNLGDGSVGDAGCLIGPARLAVDLNGPNACQFCGHCLNGCPYGSIFDAGEVFDRLEMQSRASFIRGLVTEIELHKAGVQVRVRDLADGSGTELRAQKVVLAAGALPTTGIIQRSGLARERLFVKDSQVFFLAGFWPESPGEDANRFSMAQLFATNRRASPEEDFHVSIYDFNDSYAQRARSLLRSSLGVSPPVPGFPFRFLVPGIGFISSAVSGHLELRTTDSGVSVSRRDNAASKPAIRRALLQLEAFLAPGGVRLIKALTQVPPVGSGFHLGGSLPIGGEFVDSDGRLEGDPRVLIVDASSLPSVFAGPHTLTAMANAYRCLSKAYS